LPGRKLSTTFLSGTIFLEDGMTQHQISSTDAARALAEVADRRRQVAAAAEPYPAWYPAAAGVASAVFFALADLPPSPVKTPISLAVPIGWVAVVWFAKSRTPVRPHSSMLGLAGWAVLGGILLAFAVAALAISDVLASRGGPFPHTVTGVVLGVLLAIGGTVGRLVMRRIIQARAAGPAR
jgi:hypothetical protein